MDKQYSDKQAIITANRIKSLREEKKLSHARLAAELKKKCGLSISKDSLVKYEVQDIYHSSFGATKGMKAETLYCLAKFFDVSTDYLLGNTEIKNPDPQIQSAIKYLGLSEQAINNIVCLEKGSQPDYYEYPGYIPPLVKIFNTLCEKGFVKDVTESFGRFLFHILSNHSTSNLKTLSIEDEQKIMLPAIWRLNKEIDDAIDNAVGPLKQELNYHYEGWEDIS